VSVSVGCAFAQRQEPVYLANGMKVGEVTSSSAIVWTRTTLKPERNTEGPDFVKIDRSKAEKLPPESQLPDGTQLADMKYAVPGAPGWVRLRLIKDNGETMEKDWVKTSVENDFTHQWEIEGLEEGGAYKIAIDAGRLGNNEKHFDTIEGTLKLAPPESKISPVTFTVVTGQHFERRDNAENGHEIYRHMLELKPDFFVHTGDILYYDKAAPYATSLDLARYKWHRIYSLPYQMKFHKHITTYFEKDDHDTLKNDCWPGQTYGKFTWEQGLATFREQVPMGEKTYRTARWGKDLQVWMVEGRDFRSNNRIPDGPEKTIWGEEQKKWLFESMKNSDATFRVLISPTPIVGPDRGGKSDNHANKVFEHEGNEVRKLLVSLPNTYVACGDRHWQYVSEDPETGLREYSCGPTTDKHAGGFSKDNESKMHKYLNIKGGFLAITVERRNGVPTLIARHYSADGEVYNEDVRPAK
jgi:alkaline phosphatase D